MNHDKNYLMLLSQENIELSLYEAASLLELKRYVLKKHLLISSIDKKNLTKITRLAYTKKVFELLYECNIKDLSESLKIYDWPKVYDKDFCLRIHMMEPMKILFEERDYAKHIWKSLETHKIRPKVNLDDPKTLIEIFLFKKNAYICKLLFENDEKFEDRKAHHKPELHPTAMHPRMARALVNILNPGNKTTVIDPFCGAGGIILESCLMNIKTIGYDLDQPMLNRARINLEHYHIKKGIYSLIKKDSTKLKNIKFVVTDLPYGKSSKKSASINKLYSSFIKNVSGRSVIVFPDFSDYKKILKNDLKRNLIVKKVLDHYIHKSLTRKIVVIDKK